jgi:NADH dehydrogenase FAD-containing subunit
MLYVSLAGLYLPDPANQRALKVVISQRNYFLFTPLLPSVAIGTLDARSIIQATRHITRHKARAVHVYEAEATDIDVWQMFVGYKYAYLLSVATSSP